LGLGFGAWGLGEVPDMVPMVWRALSPEMRDDAVEVGGDEGEG
jgi:hypothetical protein